MHFIFWFFGATLTSRTAACSIRATLLSLLFVVPAFPALPQATVPKDAEIRDHLQRAEVALRSDEVETAAKEFRAVLALDPRNAVAHTNLGVLAFGRGDCRVAVEEFRSALAAQPFLTKAQAFLGICQKRLGDPSARATLEKSFEKLRDKPLRIQVGMELAGLYDRGGDLDATASVMRSLVGIDPENVDVLFAAQRVYTELADDTLNKLAILAPGSARMQQVIAERLINEGDLKSATEHYRKALEIDPRLPGVRYELAEAILESAPTDPATQADAEKEFLAASQAEGDNAKTECQLGRIAFFRSDMDQAYAHFTRAFAMNPKEVDAQMGLGKLLTVMGKPEEAIKYLRMAVQSDPLNSEAHYRLATNCRKLGLTEEAAKEVRLFQEIKQAKDRVRELYKQMNKPQMEREDQLPDEKP